MANKSIGDPVVELLVNGDINYNFGDHKLVCRQRDFPKSKNPEAFGFRV